MMHCMTKDMKIRTVVGNCRFEKFGFYEIMINVMDLILKLSISHF